MEGIDLSELMVIVIGILLFFGFPMTVARRFHRWDDIILLHDFKVGGH